MCSSETTHGRSSIGGNSSDLDSLPFDDDCSKNYGVIRSELERTGQSIRPNDYASIATTHDLMLVTRNVDAFSRIVGLSWEDWEQL